MSTFAKGAYLVSAEEYGDLVGFHPQGAPRSTRSRIHSGTALTYALSCLSRNRVPEEIERRLRRNNGSVGARPSVSDRHFAGRAPVRAGCGIIGGCPTKLIAALGFPGVHQTRYRAAAEQVLDESYALMLVAPSRRPVQ